MKKIKVILTLATFVFAIGAAIAENVISEKSIVTQKQKISLVSNEVCSLCTEDIFSDCVPQTPQTTERCVCQLDLGTAPAFNSSCTALWRIPTP